tara:strand:+ start:590 stop:1321 length:732 start_codon:yes stop_codon:yes gene_type:complete
MTYVVQNEWKFDKDRLKSELYNVLEKHGINETREGGLHGVALSSQDGSLQSGFNFNVKIQSPMYQEQDMTVEDPRVYFNLKYARENKVYHMLDYEIETSACTGYFKEIMDFLHKKNMNPRRARLSYIEPDGEIKKHTDGNFYRFHIPIITTEGTDFIHGQEQYILEEGNSYLAYVHPYHMVLNKSSADRWHFVADVWDLDGNFSIGKFSQEAYEQELENATLWRDYVNGNRETPSKILVGEKN